MFLVSYWLCGAFLHSSGSTFLTWPAHGQIAANTCLVARDRTFVILIQKIGYIPIHRNATSLSQIVLAPAS